MFEVTREELSRCQIGTLNIKRGQNIKYLPFAFTELGEKKQEPLPEIGYTAIQKRRQDE